MLLAGALGAALGDWLSYWIGYTCKDRIARMRPFSTHPNLLARGEAFIQKWGALAIFIGRFSGPLRASVPIVCRHARHAAEDVSDRQFHLRTDLGGGAAGARRLHRHHLAVAAGGGGKVLDVRRQHGDGNPSRAPPPFRRCEILLKTGIGRMTNQQREERAVCFHT